MIEFKLFEKNELLYLKWAFLAGAGLAVLGFIIGLVGKVFIPKETTLESIFALIGLWLFTNIALIIIYPFVLYFVLKKVDSRVKNMNKWVVGIFTLLSIWITNIILSSIVAKGFVFVGIGLIPIAITFIVPAFYKIKNLQ